MQAQLVLVGPVGVEPAHDVDLLGDLPLAGQLRERLDGPGLDVAEPVELEGLAQGVENGLLDDPLVGQELGESGQRLGTCHQLSAST